MYQKVASHTISVIPINDSDMCHKIRPVTVLIAKKLAVH